MENFIKAMLKSKVNHKNENMGIRLFNHINTNSGYKLSVQCSEHHYCTPRKLLGIKYYNTFVVHCQRKWGLYKIQMCIIIYL